MNLTRMQGGEIFVPKIPSIYIVDLAKAVAPALPIDIIGIRPGEKLHEVMCPADDSHLTLEFDDRYLIKPSIKFFDSLDYGHSQMGQEGRPVPAGFEYNSGGNPHFLTVHEIGFLAIIAVGVSVPLALWVYAESRRRYQFDLGSIMTGGKTTLAIAIASVLGGLCELTALIQS